MSSSNTNIIPKDCSYQCGIRIYWNTSENIYYELFTKQKHSCPNRSSNSNKAAAGSATANKPNYYYNKFQKQPKPKMSNSLELLTGPFADIQRKYEILSDIVTEYQGKVHGSQSHTIGNNLLSLVVYYEVPEGKREEVKRKFKNLLLLMPIKN